MKKGFTLAELLIALAVLGVIAMFTIPKVLYSQQDASYKAVSKEFAATFSNAFEIHRAKGLLTPQTQIKEVTQYMNYVAVDTSSVLDHLYGNSGTVACGTTTPCFKLHNGAIVRHGPDRCFYGEGNAILMHFDPDGKVTGDSTLTNGPGKAINFFLYYNGRITTLDGIEPNTLVGNPTCSGTIGPYNPNDPALGAVPPWFSWD